MSASTPAFAALRVAAAEARGHLVPGAPEKYPLASVKVRILDLEAALDEIERVREALEFHSEHYHDSQRDARFVAEVASVLKSRGGRRLVELPRHLAERSTDWLNSNQKQPDEVRWGRFPLGMVQRWIERAEKAEAEHERVRELVEAASDPFLVLLEQIPEAEAKTPNPYVDGEIKRAADRLRAAVKSLEGGTS